MKIENAKILAIAVVLIMVSASFFACIDIPSADGQDPPSTQDSSAPSTYNLDIDRGYGEIFPVRNQGRIGSCWAFASSAAIECLLYMNDQSNTGRISPLAMASTVIDGTFSLNQVPAKTEGEDAIYKVGNSQTKITTGNWSKYTMLTLASGKTAVLPESSMSYDLATFDLQYDDTELNEVTSLYTVREIEMYDLIRDADEIKKMLLSGYVGVISYYSTNNRVYVPETKEMADYRTYYEDMLRWSNHAITLVGWDDNYSKDNFNEKARPENDGAWIGRNSWGTKDNFNGYTYISYESLSSTVMFIKNVELTVSENGIINTYCYDYGVSDSSDIILNGKASMANIFRSSSVSNTEVIEGVSFVTVSDAFNAIGETYTVSVYELNDNHSSPTDGRLLVSKNGKVNAGGIEYVEFDKPATLTKDKEFSVVVDLYNPDGSIIIPIDTDCSVRNIVSYTTANPGESWTCINGEWTDISSDHTSNVRIKAYTRIQAEGEGSILSFDDEQGYTRYDSITNALEDGSTDMYLLSDITLDKTVTVSGEDDIRISLNGFNATYNGGSSAFVSEISSSDDDATLTITSGRITSSKDAVTGTNVSILFSEISAGKDSQAVNTTDSLNLIYSKVSSGNVTFMPSDDAVDSNILASISGTLTVGPSNGAVLTIEGGVYADTIFDRDAAAVIEFGNFNNSIQYNDALDVNILYGRNIGKDESVIDQIIKNRSGEDYRSICSKKTGAYSFVTPDVKYDGNDKCYRAVSALTDQSDGTITFISYKDTVNRVSISSRGNNIVMGGDKVIDLGGQTVYSRSLIEIPDGLSLTVFNGTLICNGSGFKVLPGGTLIIGKEGYSTNVIVNSMPNVYNGGKAYTVGDSNQITWNYKDHFENTYKLTSDSIIFDEDKETVTFTGFGTVLDQNSRTIAECTGFKTIIGCAETDEYKGYVRFGEYHFKGYVFDRLDSCYYQPGGNPLFVETVEDHKYFRFAKDYSEVADYEMYASMSFDGTVNNIDIRVVGLKPFEKIDADYLDDAEKLITTVKKFISNTKPVKVNIILFASEEVYKDVDIPYKTFTQDNIAYCAEKGYSISLRVGQTTITADPNDLNESDLSILVKRNNNGLMNGDQLATAGDVKGYYIGCSDKGLNDISFTVSVIVNNSYKDPCFYKVCEDGSTEEVETVFKEGIVTFRTDGVGIYIVTEKGNFVTAQKAPVAKKGLSYDGGELQLIEPAIGVSHGVAEYSLDGETWSGDIPVAADAGTYTVYYRYVTTDSAYIGTAPSEIQVEIQPGFDKKTEAAIDVTLCVIVALCILGVAAVVIRRR